ncbi:hypothetical protein NKJ73_22095 [Mesorhizobium sp. M0074]|uniref:hypothetical protein n=1 Tax=unclassified Mesorhizobium TaxID=325217 RepID=UPI0033391EBF
MTNMVKSLPGGNVFVVEPGFNGVVTPDDFRALTEPANPELFDDDFLTATENKGPFIMVLGSGFETADVTGGLGACAGLASVEQLRFLQGRGLSTIVMARSHPVLVQNARAVGLDVVVGGV